MTVSCEYERQDEGDVRSELLLLVNRGLCKEEYVQEGEEVQK